jgi:hypothetical protein
VRKVIAVWLAAAGWLTLSLVVAPNAVSAPTATGPCGTRPATGAVYHHIIWVWMENHSYSTIIGAPQAPYINGLASRCGLATNYHNISHPSLPNYMAGTSGLTVSAVQKFASDCSPSATCSTPAPSIFGQGETWKSYEESMPTNCAKADNGEYAVRHNPAVYYTKLAGCATNDVPYPHLAADLAANKLPAFSFVTPNLIDDMHSGTVTQGDSWLSKNLPVIFNSAEYRSGSVAVLITWDEGEGGLSTNCPANVTDIGCHVATIVASPTTKVGAKSATLFNHWSLLRTTEQLLGLPLLGQAATATSMSGPFGL